MAIRAKEESPSVACPSDFCEIVVEALGSGGQPLVLLHGWGQSRSDLRPLGQLLARDNQVLLVDLPGFGESQMPTGAWGTAEYAKRLAARLVSLELSAPPILVGHSFGGRVALQFAHFFPEKTRGLVLIAAAGLPRRRTLLESIRFRAVRLLGASARLIQRLTSWPAYRWFGQRFGSRDYRNAGQLRSVLVATLREDLSAIAAKINCPALLLWGAQDTETPVEMAFRFQALLQRSTLVTFPEKDHFPHRGAGSQLCAFRILQWMDKVKAR